jgi:hypothetical protein
MKQSTYRLVFVLAIALGLSTTDAFAQKGGRSSGTFNKAARGTSSQKANNRSKSGDKTGATGRSSNLLKPRFETRGPSKGNKPRVPKL